MFPGVHMLAGCSNALGDQLLHFIRSVALQNDNAWDSEIE
jgi:hypothetical protein